MLWDAPAPARRRICRRRRSGAPRAGLGVESIVGVVDLSGELGEPPSPAPSTGALVVDDALVGIVDVPGALAGLAGAQHRERHHPRDPRGRPRGGAGLARAHGVACCSRSRAAARRGRDRRALPGRALDQGHRGHGRDGRRRRDRGPHRGRARGAARSAGAVPARPRPLRLAGVDSMPRRDPRARRGRRRRNRYAGPDPHPGDRASRPRRSTGCSTPSARRCCTGPPARRSQRRSTGEELDAGERLLAELQDAVIEMRTLPLDSITASLPARRARPRRRRRQGGRAGHHRRRDPARPRDPRGHLGRRSPTCCATRSPTGSRRPQERLLPGKHARRRASSCAPSSAAAWSRSSVADDGRGVSPELLARAAPGGFPRRRAERARLLDRGTR